MKRTEKVLRYSIRKSVLGVGSVLICALFLGHSMVAADEEQPVANAVETSGRCIASKSGFDNGQGGC